LKGTKLWQAPGSPIIQGRSRNQRPSWQQWVPAGLISAAVAVGYLYVSAPQSGGSPWLFAGAIMAAFLSALLGVHFTRSMAWRFPAAWGAVAGVAGAALVIALGTNVFGA
jgi:hypothetical protein